VLAFVGSITCVRKSKHIFLEFFYRYLNAKLVKGIILLVEILITVFFAYFSWLTIGLANETTQRMVSLDLPKSLVYYVIAVSCFLSAVFAVLNLIKNINSSAEDIYSEKLNIKR